MWEYKQIMVRYVHKMEYYLATEMERTIDTAKI